jgi:hypothetical protein
MTASRPPWQVAQGEAGVFVEATAWSAADYAWRHRIWPLSPSKGSQFRKAGAPCRRPPAHAGQGMARPWHGNGPLTPVDLERGDKLDIVAPSITRSAITAQAEPWK